MLGQFKRGDDPALDTLVVELISRPAWSVEFKLGMAIGHLQEAGRLGKEAGKKEIVKLAGKLLSSIKKGLRGLKLDGFNDPIIVALRDRLIASGSGAEFNLGLAVGWMNDMGLAAEERGNQTMAHLAQKLLQIVKSDALARNLKGMGRANFLGMMSLMRAR